jgi:hypothetical protein
MVMNVNFQSMKLRIGLLLVTLITLGLATGIVVQTEEKKAVKNLLGRYALDYANWQTYTTQYQEQLLKILEENKITMANAKTQYLDLLAKQPDLIKQNTRIEQYLSPTATTPQTTTQTVTVSKPKSKPTTKSS